MIAIRYVGTFAVYLEKTSKPYRNADGAFLDLVEVRPGAWKYVLAPGDTLLVPEDEALGITYLVDPRGEQEPVKLGSGLCLIPEHQGRNWQELIDVRFTYGSEKANTGIWCYEFHMPRADFEPLEPDARRINIEPLQQQEQVVVAQLKADPTTIVRVGHITSKPATLTVNTEPPPTDTAVPDTEA